MELTFVEHVPMHCASRYLGPVCLRTHIVARATATTRELGLAGARSTYVNVENQPRIQHPYDEQPPT
jgi:hypothetical protein